VLPGDYAPLSREDVDQNKKAESSAGSRRRVAADRELLDRVLEAEGDVPPAYRFKWDLAADTNVVRGVMYMAELNPDEPAAMVMAGLVAVRNRAYHLGIAAYERAILLGSPQADLLHLHIADLKKYIEGSKWHGTILYDRLIWIGILTCSAFVCLCGYRRFKKRLGGNTYSLSR
jgi:hypothetical protein